MSQRIPVNPGHVDWSGENPGIYLKHGQDGDWSTLAIFFRVVLSPHGRGHTMIVLERPDEAVGHPQAANLCLTDNQVLTHYLIDEFNRDGHRLPVLLGDLGVAGEGLKPRERPAAAIDTLAGRTGGGRTSA